MVRQRFAWYVFSNINKNATPVSVPIKAIWFAITFYQKLRSEKKLRIIENNNPV